VRRILLLIVASVMISGCSAAAVPGSPSPAPAAESAGLDLPARPREIRLDDIDPCSLLTAEQRTEIGFTDDLVAYTGTAPGFEGPACALQGFEPRAVTLGILLSLENDISVLTAPGASRGQLTPISVEGFPAVLARPTITSFCAVDVDVADGQFLDVQFSDGGRRPPVSQDELCRDVVGIATRVVQTLQRQ
jgi:hypothetical protein